MSVITVLLVSKDITLKGFVEDLVWVKTEVRHFSLVPCKNNCKISYSIFLNYFLK